MSVTVDLYTFAKKRNSTAIPASAPVSFACTLKDPCSIINPTIAINNGATWNPAQYNYAKIASFNRYYYVSDWTYSRGLWYATLTVDALASWRANIYNATEYVMRASADFDGAIIDTMFPAKSTYTQDLAYWDDPETGHNTPWINSLDGGFYVVSIINSDSNSLGAMSYYMFTPSQFANFKGFLLGDLTWTGILVTNPDIGENLFKALFNPFQYIGTVFWFPFAPPDIGESVSSIKVGWWDINNISCKRITDYYFAMSYTLRVSKHPESDSRGVYLNGAPYSEYTLFAPPFGTFPLDATRFPSALYTSGSTPVTCGIVVDLISGQGKLIVVIADTTALTTITQIAVPIQLAQMTSVISGDNAVNALTQSGVSLAKSMAGSSTGSRIPENFSLLNAVAVGDIQLYQTGSNGSLCQYTSPFFIKAKYYDMTEAAIIDKGLPLCKEVQLSTLAPGYVITAESHIAIPATDAEISAVNDALDGGVFLE